MTGGSVAGGSVTGKLLTIGSEEGGVVSTGSVSSAEVSMLLSVVSPGSDCSDSVSGTASVVVPEVTVEVVMVSDSLSEGGLSVFLHEQADKSIAVSTTKATVFFISNLFRTERQFLRSFFHYI